MNNISDRLVICGVDEVSCYQNLHITHMVSVANPKAHIVRPTWFSGEHLELYFGDVISSADAAQYNTVAPSYHDVVRAVDFTCRAWGVSGSKVLIHCDYGASRSPALAYVALANELGVGSEEKVLQTILEIQPSAVPNKLVVQLGDSYLRRDGALLMPLFKLYKIISEELSAI